MIEIYYTDRYTNTIVDIFKSTERGYTITKWFRENDITYGLAPYGRPNGFYLHTEEDYIATKLRWT